MTRAFALLTCFTILISTPALAQDTIFGGTWAANLGATSDYVFRGISQSDENPAFQGSLDWTHNSGAYLGVWGSTVDFDDADVEIDLSGGWGGTLDNGMIAKLGVTYYAYPGAASSLNYDYWELGGSLGYDFDLLTTTLGMNISPDYFAGSGTGVYSYIDAAVPIKLGQSFDLSLTGHAGNQTISDNDAFGSPDYVDWNFGVAATYAGYTARVQYIDTNLETPNECAVGCDSRVVFGLSKAF